MVSRSYRSIAWLMSLLMTVGAVMPALAQTPAASPTSGVTPTFTEQACERELPKGVVEGTDAVCGTVTAPMYPGTDRPETVELAVIRMLATTDTPAAEPLLILNGGPGQSLDAVLPAFGADMPLFAYMRDRQDVILFDQRGMGMSTPSLSCPFEQTASADELEATPDATPVIPETTEEYNAQMAVKLDGCGATLSDGSIDLSAFTTTSNAADIDAIRIALGVDQVDLYGISYGSKLALAAVRDYPDSIRSTIIASPLPLEADVFSEQVIGFNDALLAVFDGCAADAECAATNPNLQESFLSSVEKLKANPLVASLTDPTTGDTIDMPVDASMYLQIVYLSVFVGSLTPLLPLLITTVEAGDASIIREIMLITLTVQGGVNNGVLLTYFCQEEAPFESEEAYNTAIADAGVMEPLADGTFSSIGMTMYGSCDAWEVEPADPIENEPVVSDEPILIMTGTYDPITPPRYGEEVAANFPNSTLIEFAAQGHDPASVANDCAPAIITGFLNDPAAEIDASCASTPADFSPEWLYGAESDASPAASPEATPAP